MDVYIGIDVHTESCTFAAMKENGKRIEEFVVETSGEAIVEAVQNIRGQKHVCLEEGTLAEWLFELLEPIVDELVVTIPEKSRGNKSDSRDAWRRADELRRNSNLRSVFKAPGCFTGLRAAAKAYNVTQRDMVRTKVRLNALFRSRGIHGMASEIYDPAQRSSWHARLPAPQRHQAELLSTQLDGLTSSHQLAHAWLLDESKKVPILKLIATAPGIGELRAAQIVAVVISPHRFRTRRQFWSYCGLGIVTRSSADWTTDRKGQWVRRVVPQTRGLNRNRQPMLKNVFKGAARTVLAQPEHPLKLTYDRALAAGTKPNLARLTLARRIAGAVLAMWKNKEEYDPAKQRQH